MNEAPKFSVIIPTFRRPDGLKACLERLSPDLQSLGASCYEIIVSDDGGAMSPELAARFPHVRFVTGPGRGPAANRNFGASKAVGEWLVFIDDDTLPSPGCLAAYDAMSREADVLEGKITCPPSPDSIFFERVENPSGGVFWSANFAIRRECFEQVGRFDEMFPHACYEDMEFFSRVKGSGLRVRFCAGAEVIHPPRRIGWRGIWRRTFQTKWFILFLIKTGARESALGWALKDLLRSTIKLTNGPPGRWRYQALMTLWRWAISPVLIPYLVFWEWRFRKQLAGT